MENKKKIFFFFVKLGIFSLESGKNILFGIGNGAEFRPKNRVIKSPAIFTFTFMSVTSQGILGPRVDQ